MQIKFYVPERFEEYTGVGAVLADIARMAGGITVYRADGLWVDANDEPVCEAVGVFEVFFLPEDTAAGRLERVLLGRLLETLANILSTAGEKSFLYTVDNKPTFIDLSKVATITL